MSLFAKKIIKELKDAAEAEAAGSGCKYTIH